MKLRLQPIRVFCLHHVCENYDEETMCAWDWMGFSVFQSKINDLRTHGYKFISLSEAYQYMQNDWIRTKKYAVLTFDDGCKSLQEVLPWLEKQGIPSTLFINGKYLDGKSFRNTDKEHYLTYNELIALGNHLIEIGSHGYEHADASKMSADRFKEHIEKNLALLSNYPNYIPFHAYTWGKHTEETDSFLIRCNTIPVYMDGMKNYNNKYFIHRELL